MGIKVHVDLNIMNHKFSEDQLRRGRLSMANDAQQAMEKYVPKKSGELRDHAKVATDGSSVYYVAPYARAQFMDLLPINMVVRLEFIITPRLEHQDVGT